MLRTRLITAAIVLPLVVASIIWLPTPALAVLFGGLLAIGAWEWSGLMALSSKTARGVLAGLCTCIFAVCWVPAWRAQIAVWLLPLAVVWWLLAIVLLIRFPRGWDLSTGWPGFGATLGLLVLAAPFTALVALHAWSRGAFLVLFLFVLIWAADTGAYFAGRAWGRAKLAPAVSPGKSREGAYGGIGLALVAAALGGWIFGFAGLQLLVFVLLGGVTAAVSIIGDLTVSMFKRQAGVKDSGNIFPGHGGVLDRLDSVFAAAPVFVLGLELITR